MSRVLNYLCTTMGLLALSSVSADTTFETSSAEMLQAPAMQAPAAAPLPVAKAAPEVPFSAFTGKVKARKVRMRLQPSLESHIIKELSKGDLLLIVGEKEDFYAVEAPADTKAYVFRGLVMDNVVEANRVNVRLHPDLEAPVIGHLNAGDRVNSVLCAENNKWVEIAPPAHTRFYISKEFIERAGGPEVKAHADKRRSSVEHLFDAASLHTKAEFRKPFDEIDVERISRNYNTIINDYSDFPDYVEQAKDALAKLHEAYLQKKIAFLEKKDQPVAAKANNSSNAVAKAAEKAPEESLTERMKLWEPIEESLYLSWTNLNDNKSMDEFYQEQKLAAVPVTGILEAYTAPVKNKPGDFILRDKDLPIAYIYSTQVNLQHLVGKKVTVHGVPRPNNNFAFPAYFVLSAE